jgi:hypothetical protein
MATGKIIFVQESPRGPVGYVADDAIRPQAPELNIYFDARCLQDGEAVVAGDRVEFKYEIDLCKHDKPRMKFDTLKKLNNEETIND